MSYCSRVVCYQYIKGSNQEERTCIQKQQIRVQNSVSCITEIAGEYYISNKTNVSHSQQQAYWQTKYCLTTFLTSHVSIRYMERQIKRYRSMTNDLYQCIIDVINNQYTCIDIAYSLNKQQQKLPIKTKILHIQILV